jgi:hypothetical protein
VSASDPSLTKLVIDGVLTSPTQKLLFWAFWQSSSVSGHNPELQITGSTGDYSVYVHVLGMLYGGSYEGVVCHRYRSMTDR